MRTFKQLQDEALRYFDVEDEEDGSADREMVKAALNQANQKRATEDKWKFMLSRAFTLSVIAGQQEYILPHENLDKLQYLYSTTHKRFIISVPMRQVPYADIGFNDEVTDSNNKYFELVGYSGVKKQPTVVGPLDVSSSEDETDCTVYIEGEDEDGATINETLTITTTTETTTQDFARITYVTKVGDFAGTLLIEDSAGEEMLTLTTSQQGKQFPVIRFLTVPVTAETCTYRYWRTPRVMERDNDLPDIPFPQCNILVYDALLALATYNELDSESVNIWRDQQMRWEMNLYLMKMEANTVGGNAEYINETGLMY
jgi:hypothetical protein